MSYKQPMCAKVLFFFLRKCMASIMLDLLRPRISGSCVAQSWAHKVRRGVVIVVYAMFCPGCVSVFRETLMIICSNFKCRHKCLFFLFCCLCRTFQSMDHGCPVVGYRHSLALSFRMRSALSLLQDFFFSSRRSSWHMHFCSATVTAWMR